MADISQVMVSDVSTSGTPLPLPPNYQPSDETGLSVIDNTIAIDDPGTYMIINIGGRNIKVRI